MRPGAKNPWIATKFVFSHFVVATPCSLLCIALMWLLCCVCVFCCCAYSPRFSRLNFFATGFRSWPCFVSVTYGDPRAKRRENRVGLFKHMEIHWEGKEFFCHPLPTLSYMMSLKELYSHCCNENCHILCFFGVPYMIRKNEPYGCETCVMFMLIHSVSSALAVMNSIQCSQTPGPKLIHTHIKVMIFFCMKPHYNNSSNNNHHKTSYCFWHMLLLWLCLLLTECAAWKMSKQDE